ncbi:unnamed protein product [Effrenium voratum]|nr:unnamed protein product [Effrenium voratum]
MDLGVQTGPESAPAKPDAGWPAMRWAFEQLLQKLLSVDAQSHEEQNWLVGLSCLMLATPAIFAAQEADWTTVGFSVVVTVTSLCADYLFIGSAWHIIDRWCAIAFALYMYAQALPSLPLLSTLNAVPLFGFLTYSRCGRGFPFWFPFGFLLVFDQFPQRRLLLARNLCGLTEGRVKEDPVQRAFFARAHLFLRVCSSVGEIGRWSDRLTRLTHFSRAACVVLFVCSKPSRAAFF